MNFETIAALTFVEDSILQSSDAGFLNQSRISKNDFPRLDLSTETLLEEVQLVVLKYNLENGD